MLMCAKFVYSSALSEVSTKSVQEYPHSRPHGGPMSTALKAEFFLQLLGCLISCSLYEEKISPDGHPDTV